MQVKINLDFLNHYLLEYFDKFFYLEIKDNTFSLEIQQDPLLTALNPYALLELKKELSATWTNLYWDHNIITKFNKTDEDFIVVAEVKENYDIKPDLNRLKQDLVEILNKYYANIEVTIDAIEIDESRVSIAGVLVDKINIINSNPVLKTEIFYSVDELYQLYAKNLQITKIKYAKDIFQGRYGRPLKDYYIVLFKDDRVIGLSHMFESNEVENSLCTSFTSIIEEEQGKGYSHLILEKRIELLKQLNMNFHSSSYSPEGFDRLRPRILEMCQQNGIKIHENGLHLMAKSFPQAVFSEQKQYEEKIKSAKHYKENNFFTMNGYINVDDELLIEFLKENVHKLTNKEECLVFYKKYERFLDDFVAKFLN